MHMVFHAVLHFTVLAIIGYLLLYTASKADGIVALIGRLLGLWVFILAILAVVAGVAMSGGKGWEGMHGHGMGWMHHWDREGPPDQAAPAAPAQTATPPAPAAPTPAPVKKPTG
jgi:hypothetical protein